MSDLVVQQALFGYRDGHDLLASSVDLDGETLRLLRSASDANVDGLAGRYLSTVIPLPKMRCHAFIRSWSAIGDVRPGSVYAHVILIDAVALGRLKTFQGVRKAFTYPASDDKHFASYRKALVIAADKPTKSVPFEISLPIASAVYGSRETVFIGEPDLETAEAILYGLLSQQWPKLRREFAFRTRLRPTETTWRVDVEVIARAPQDLNPPNRWGFKIARDLEEPDPLFRRFLARYGAESKRGRADMPFMVDLFEVLGTGDFDRACEMLVANYPSPADMRVLKREAFGQSPSSDSDREIAILGAVLEYADSFDVDALDLGGRVALAAMERPAAAQSMLGRLNLPTLSDETVEALVGSLSRHATSGVLASIAKSNTELGVLVVGLRPVLLGVREVWLDADFDLLTDVYFSASRSDQREILEQLVSGRSREPLAAICGRQPAVWWDLLAEVARLPAHDQSDPSTFLGEVLSSIGTSAVTTPAATLSNSDLGVLLQASGLGNGLWRRVEASRWIELALALEHLDWPPFMRDRAASVALVAGNSNFSADTRSRAWRATFGTLHERLKRSDFDGQSWELLSTLLPAAPSWDRCLRLRRGVVSEARRDRWSLSASEALIKESRGYESEMRDEIDRIHKPSRTWLEHVLSRMTGLGGPDAESRNH